MIFYKGEMSIKLYLFLKIKEYFK